MINERNLALCIIFTFITCGIYGIYWFVCITNDVSAVSGEHSISGVMAFVLTVITCGIYGLIWAFKMGERIDIAKQKRGIPASNGGILYLILFIFGGIIAYALIQYELNKLAA